jgi:hypothetical protein
LEAVRVRVDSWIELQNSAPYRSFATRERIGKCALAGARPKDGGGSVHARVVRRSFPPCKYRSNQG